jgi:hypothetical protein
MLKGLKGHDVFLDLLSENNFKGTIHSIFHSALNIKGDDHCLYSVLSSKFEHVPYSIILDTNSPNFMALNIGDNVFLEDKIMHVGTLTISLEDIMPYTLCLPQFTINEELLTSNISFVNNTLSDIAKDAPTTPFEQAAQNLLEENTRKFIQSLKKKNEMEIIKNAQGIIGLGHGLTPTGDDYITAILATVVMPNSPTNVLQPVMKKIVESARVSTNEVSYALLKRAYSGFVREKLSDFLLAMMNSDDVTKELNSLLTIGFSSGKDLAQGIVWGLEIALDN